MKARYLLSHYILGLVKFFFVSKIFSTPFVHLTHLRPVRLAQLTDQPLRIGRVLVESLAESHGRIESLLTMAFKFKQINADECN